MLRNLRPGHLLSVREEGGKGRGRGEFVNLKGGRGDLVHGGEEKVPEKRQTIFFTRWGFGVIEEI